MIEWMHMICSAATPGPWKHDWGNADIETGLPDRHEIVVRGEHHNYEANLEFIATFNPTNVAKLLAMYAAAVRLSDNYGGEARERDLDDLRDAIDSLKGNVP